MYKHFGKWLIVLLLLIAVVPAMAQDTTTLPLAVVQDGNVWLYGMGDAPQQITDGTAVDYSYPVWSADGNYLAFIARDISYNANLMVYDRANGTLTRIEQDVADGFPVRFSFDGSQLFYLKDSPTNDGSTPDYVMDFYTLTLPPGGQPELAGSFNFGVGCGGGSPFPMDWRYTSETLGFSGFHLIMEVTPFGLVHSMDCGGWETGLLNLETGEDVSLGQISRAVVSADRTKVAGIIGTPADRTNDRLVVVDLQSLESTEINTAGMPDQVTWGAVGSSELFYSTRTEADPLPVSDEGQERINAYLGTEFIPRQWEAGIHRLDVNTGEDTMIYDTDDYAIGRMIATPDSLVFSEISNGEDWFNAIAEGTLQVNSPDALEQSNTLVTVDLLRLPLAGGEPEMIGADFNQAALSPIVVTP